MISRRGIVIIVLIGLAIVASSTRPWMSGAKLLEAKYSSRFDPYIDMGGSTSASAPFEEAFSAAGIKRVVIQAPMGNITVIKTGGNSIAVEGERIAYGDTMAEAEAKLPLVSLEAKTCDDVLEIVGLVDRSATSGLSGMINMVIQVPAGVDVESTLSMGKIALDGIEGSFCARVEMGEVNAHSTRGDLDINISTGAINVSDAVVAKKLNLVTSMGPIDFAGVLGEHNHIESSAVRIRIPRSTCVQVDADASAGQIESSFPITGLSSEKLKSSAIGILGEGTPTGELRVRTSGGEIHISEL